MTLLAASSVAFSLSFSLTCDVSTPAFFVSALLQHFFSTSSALLHQDASFVTLLVESIPGDSERLPPRNGSFRSYLFYFIEFLVCLEYFIHPEGSSFEWQFMAVFEVIYIAVYSLFVQQGLEELQ